MDKDFFSHSSAVISEDSKIGKNTKIWHFSHVFGSSILGDDCTIGQNVMIGPNVKIGNRCKIQNNVSLYKGIILEDNVFCGPSCVFTNVKTPRAFIDRSNEFTETFVRKGASIGANSTIICGVELGSYSFSYSPKLKISICTARQNIAVYLVFGALFAPTIRRA